MFKKISITVFLVALSVFTAQAVSAESGPRSEMRPLGSRPLPIKAVRPMVRASSTVGINATGTMMRRDDRRDDRRDENQPPVMEAQKGERVVSGKVTSISGNTLTVDVIVIGRSTTTKSVATSTISYSVDATTSKVFKERATSTVSSIVVGDIVVVNGKVTGATALKAKVIQDLGAINPLRRAEDVNKIKDRKDGENRGGNSDRNNDGIKDGEDNGNDGNGVQKEGLFKRIGKFFGF